MKKFSHRVVSWKLGTISLPKGVNAPPMKRIKGKGMMPQPGGPELGGLDPSRMREPIANPVSLKSIKSTTQKMPGGRWLTSKFK